MRVRDKTIFLLGFICVVIAFALLFVFSRIVSNRLPSSTAETESDRYEDVSKSGETVINGIEQGIQKSFDQVQQSRAEIADSLNGIGDIRQSVGTIEGENESVLSAVSRIESGILEIEGIIQQAEKETEVLANNDSIVCNGYANNGGS